MFGGRRRTARKGVLLLAAAVGRLRGIEESLDPLALVRQLKAFLDGVQEATARTGGNVLQFVGNLSLAVWVCEPGDVPPNPVSIGRRVLRDVRSTLTAQEQPSWPQMLLCVGLAMGECVYEWEDGRVVGVVGDPWFRVRDFPAKLGGDEDALLLDRSLKDVLPPDARLDLGDGWYLVPAESGLTRAPGAP